VEGTFREVRLGEDRKKASSEEPAFV
jgi:hypothetical protein